LNFVIQRVIMDDVGRTIPKDAGKRIADNWDKPLSPPRPVPKPSSLKKKGRPPKESE
jgi:hypothetical protein